MSHPETTFCPYVGLQPYTEAEREYFFGRERDTRVIVANLYASSLTILYGASGVGKSSVLLAGVVPRLRAAPRTAVIVFREWQDLAFLRTLKAACVAAVEGALGKPVAVDPNLPFDELLGQAAQALNGTLVIILDQFEEYFLYQPESRSNDSFDPEFARAVNRDDVGASFLLSLREDGLSKLDRFRTRIPNLLGNTLRLQHLDAAAAEDAILKPLDVYNAHSQKSIGIEPGLVREVISSTMVPASGETKGEARIETPFLQLVMTRLWDEEMKAGSNTLRLSTLQRLGGAGRIVRTHLDRIMSQLSESERGISALFFDRLVTPSGTKIALRVDDLVAYAHRPEQQVKPILKKLSDGRVLRPIAPPPGQPNATRYEIFHDVLAPAILDWRQRYLQARERRTWLRIVAAGLSVLLLVIVVLAITAIYQSYQAQVLGVVASTEVVRSQNAVATAQVADIAKQTEAARSQTSAARAQIADLAAKTQAANAQNVAQNALATPPPQNAATLDPAALSARATAVVVATSAAQVSEGWCPCAKARPIVSSNFQDARGGLKAKAVVLHIAGGPQSAIFPTLNNPSFGSSDHFSVGKTGAIEQYVSITDTAYANGLRYSNGQWLSARGAPISPTWQDLEPGTNPNYYTVSIMLEGQPEDQWTPQMFDAVNRILVWLAPQLGITYTPHHTLIGLYEINPVERPNSPGPNVDYERIANDANAALAAQKAAKALPWIPINTNSVMYQFAQAKKLGFPQTDEFQFTYANSPYIGQVFDGGIVYVKQGDWGNVHSIDKTSAYPTGEAGAASAAAKRITWMPIQRDSVLYQFAQKSQLGYPQTAPFDFTEGRDSYTGQVFNQGIVYAKKGSSDVRLVSKPN